ncbi:uncharacterized protein LOC111622112 isoform X2 [Centruroides sculpturatus]|uniref:uncharacterized protein LOC111622112 isoform X2 n=1 Tax=Centruroides sculpturatus TaxID=218467 RepID=UPI000C6D4A12|nr:uncharacterized protein LOC111622112 isoform X2 [Centruroides sculpturatus]
MPNCRNQHRRMAADQRRIRGFPPPSRFINFYNCVLLLASSLFVYSLLKWQGAARDPESSLSPIYRRDPTVRGNGREKERVGEETGEKTEARRKSQKDGVSLLEGAVFETGCLLAQLKREWNYRADLWKSPHLSEFFGQNLSEQWKDDRKFAEVFRERLARLSEKVESLENRVVKFNGSKGAVDETPRI